MSALPETIFSPADLAWHHSRITLAELPPEERRTWEELAEWIGVRAPDDVEPVMDEEAEGRLAEICVALYGDEKAPQYLDTITGDDVTNALEEARLEGEKDATIPSRANTAERKAMRLLIERRLVVERIVNEGDLDGLVVAKCRGDSGEIHSLGYDPRRRQYRCTCPEMKGACSHLIALKMVTTTKGER